MLLNVASLVSPLLRGNQQGMGKITPSLPRLEITQSETFYFFNFKLVTLSVSFIFQSPVNNLGVIK